MRFWRWRETSSTPHHERWDGTGYPRRLRGTEIPVEGRVMAVVDVWDATTTATASPERIVLVQNSFEELKAKLPK